jgi:hypothetical protein
MAWFVAVRALPAASASWSATAVVAILTAQCDDAISPAKVQCQFENCWASRAVLASAAHLETYIDQPQLSWLSRQYAKTAQFAFLIRSISEFIHRVWKEEVLLKGLLPDRSNERVGDTGFGGRAHGVDHRWRRLHRI